MTKLLWRAVTAAIKPVTIMLRLNNVPQYGAWLFNPRGSRWFRELSMYLKTTNHCVQQERKKLY